MSRAFTDDERTKIKQLITEGVQITSDIDALKGGLSDTVKAIAEELELKPMLLKRAIRTAAKANRDKQRMEFDELEIILDTVGLG